MSNPEPVEALRLLRDACQRRDAVVSAGHKDQLDHALAQYIHALQRANAAIERDLIQACSTSGKSDV